MYRLAPDAKTSREMFETAQWAQSSEAAASLAQMAARGGSGVPGVSARVRERQDLVAEWQKRDGLRNAALSQEAGKRNVQAEAANLERLAAIDARIREIDRTFKDKFPDYAALASPAPLAVEEVQAQLGADEALVLFLDTPEFKPTPEETFIWVVTKTDLRWVRSDLGAAALAREVQALRCGLDAAAWQGPRCTELTGQSYTDMDDYAGKPLPFDFARAHALYKGLFSEAEDVIKGKHLLIVPSGALTQLPFQVLVTAPPPADGDHKSAAWLIRDHALTVLPAVSSLKALRRVARPSAAQKPMIGFGNPLLDGGPANADDRQRALDFKHCPIPQSVASNKRSLGGVAPPTTRGGLADPAFLRKKAPLPETAFELCAVARDLNADPEEIYLGERATEREVKALSKSGKLAQYRIVHFATHGALSGEFNGSSEPGLLMTPPDKQSEEDDGYLTASEIAGLKLDANWVILSACNTAAGGASGAEALSGLARAFFYAQARALLVSHWEVASDTTVKLITGAMSRLAADKSMGRAEAMRQSMLALIDKGAPQEAHPAFWAPFVVVGEGGVTVPLSATEASSNTTGFLVQDLEKSGPSNNPTSQGVRE
jgi:CHAT domain-containing protein